MVFESPYRPEVCVWELTLRCNMRCIHCGSTAGVARDNELAVDECLAVAADLAALGCRQATFIGGEVFLFPGWEEVAASLAERAIDVNIITNGFLMRDAQVEQVKRAQLSNVGISLDGMEDNHNRIRASGKSFGRAMAAFDRLNREDISLGVVTSLLDFNFYDLDAMYDLLVDNGVVIWQLQIATPMGNMAGNRGFALDPAKVPQLTAFIREKREPGKIRVYAGDDIGYFDENEMYLRNRPGTISTWQGCQAGLKVVGIDSVGNVKGCESIYADEFIEGNLREESLAEIWHKEGNFAYNREFDPAWLTGRCAGCDKGQLCRGGCRGSAYFTSGSLFDNAYCCYRPKDV
jgi:radical SAM protein with 4Fe4S-binding SPASM domain